jgi:hypothetical protein
MHDDTKFNLNSNTEMKTQWFIRHGDGLDVGYCARF